MSVSIDTNVLISATLWHGSVAQKLLTTLIVQDVGIYSSPEIIAEYENVLKRDFEYNSAELANILKEVLTFIILIEPTDKVNVVEKDPDDNKIVECALASGSQYIITYDKELLELRGYKNIKIIKPEEARLIF